MDFAIGQALGSLLHVLVGLRTELIAPIGIVLAIIVTIHVLLNKRDIGAAAAWIGLAWLSPFLGGFAYLILGINRVRRRAIKLAGRRRGRRGQRRAASRGWEGHLGALEHAGSRITGRRVLTGNAFRPLRNGDAAYPDMLAAIDAAERTVMLSSYIFRGDRTGRAFVDALARARSRDVQVRVMIDGIGSGYVFSKASRLLRRAGIPYARFMHSFMPWRMPFLNLRTHKKILVVDGTRGFTGGMNLADENVLGDDPTGKVRDFHFEVAGPVVAQLSDAFAQDWDFVTGESLDPSVWSAPVPPAGEAHARVATSGPDNDLEKIEFLMMQAVACARERVRILTPYFLPEERLITALCLAAMRGVDVEVVIPARSNHLMVDLATRANIGPLLTDGVKIFLNGPPFDHSKLMVVDDLWCLIGSANWDMRSLRLNFELTMEVYDEALAAALLEVIGQRKGRPLLQADLDRRRLPTRLVQAALRLLLPYL